MKAKRFNADDFIDDQKIINECINNAIDNIRTQQQIIIIDDILNIYNGVYINYEDYRTKKLCDEPYTFILSQELFEYIKNKKE